MKFKFDAKGKYSLNAHISSGYYFNWAFADSGWGSTANTEAVPLAHDLAPYYARDVIPGVVHSTVQNILHTYYPNASPALIAQLTPVLTAQVTAQVTPIITNSLEQPLPTCLQAVIYEDWN